MHKTSKIRAFDPLWSRPLSQCRGAPDKMLQKNNIIAALRRDPARRQTFALRAGDWHFDYAALPLTAAQRSALVARWTGSDHLDRVRALFAGEQVNESEQQPALHMALRATKPAGYADSVAVAEQRHRFLDLAERLHSGQQGLTDLIHLGIGGSDLGPRLVADAINDNDSAVKVHWCATVDGRRMRRLLASLDPATTGLVIASKSFTTEETLLQARAVKAWLGERFAAHTWEATASPARALDFGINEAHLLTFPSWTGGRFSLWSAVGVSAAAAIGRTAFEALLAGAEQADQAMQAESEADAPQGLAVWMALVLHHLRREMDYSTLSVVSYTPRLALLGDYLQQLVMESLGKGVDREGQPLSEPTSPLILGGRGTDLQHSIFQAIHQGPDNHPMLLVGCVDDESADPAWSRVQLAHLLGQARALTYGRQDGTPHQRMPGHRPTMVLLAPRLTAHNLGYLLASFEHAVFALATLWRINPFDQWGVEEGKRLAGRYRQMLEARTGKADDGDLSTLLAWLDRY